MADKVRAKLAAVHTKLEGKYVLVYLNFGESATEASPKWAMIGGQKSGDLDLSADSIDASDKTSGGWGEKYPGIKTSELSVEGNIVGGDEAYQALRDASTPVNRLISAGTTARQDGRPELVLHYRTERRNAP